MIAEEEYIHFLIKNDLTQEQYLCLHLIYKNRVDLIKLYKEAFPSGGTKMIPDIFIKDLINKGFLVVKNKSFKLGKAFLELFIEKHRATEEIYNIYPSFYDNGGVAVPLTTMDMNVFANMYENAIMGSLEEHIEIMKDIEFGKKHDLLKLGIEKFLKSKYWKVLRAKRIKDIDLDTPGYYEHTY